MTTKSKTPKAQPKAELEKQIQERDILVDAAYPDEFIDTFVTTCFHTVDRYLELSHAPEEIRNLLDLTRSMQIEYSQVENGKTRVRNNEAMSDLIAELSQLVAAAGGEFIDYIGLTMPRENSILAKLKRNGKG